MTAAAPGPIPPGFRRRIMKTAWARSTKKKAVVSYQGKGKGP